MSFENSMHWFQRWLSRGPAWKLLVLTMIVCGSAHAGDPKKVFGRVIDADGKAIPSARVTLLYSEGRSTVEEQTATVNAQGEFHLQAKAAVAEGDDVRWTVVGEAAGYGIRAMDVSGDGKGDLVLGPETEGSLLLTDEKGTPLAGVRVRPDTLLGGLSSRREVVAGTEISAAAEKAEREARQMSLRYSKRMAELAAQVSDAEGVCQIKGLPQGARLRVGIDDDRFARPGWHEEIPLGKDVSKNGIVLPLIPASVVTGVVRYGSSGLPALGVRVCAQSADDDGNWEEAVTDASGRYAIKRMRPGIYNVALDLYGTWGEQWTSRAHEKLTLARSASRSEIDFELITGALIRGKVTIAGGDAPVSGVRIGVYGPAHPQSSAWVQATKTGPDGAYVLRVPPGDQYVYFQSLVPVGLRKPVPSDYEITLSDGERRVVDFRLERE